MADPEAQRSKKVSQSAIDEIKKLGMSAALKKYTAGDGSPEFKTAMERYYSPQRLKAASSSSKPATQNTPSSTPSAPVPMPASAPAAASRRTGGTGMAQALGAPSKPQSNKPKNPSAYEAAVNSGGRGGSVSFSKPKAKPTSVGQSGSIARGKAKAEELSNKRMQNR